MEKRVTHRRHLKGIFRPSFLSSILALTVLSVTIPAAVQEQIYFPAHDNAEAQIVARINAETVRLDIAVWLLDDGSITQAVINRFQAGVPVRVLGDRASLFESDPHTRASFERLASAGIPIRLRYFPTDFPQIIHWKYGGFTGQNSAVIGSGNWTSFELKPTSSTNFKDETEMFTNDPKIVNALRTQFDKFWVDTTYFLDWPAAYKRETGIDWTTPTNIQRVRLEPDYPTDALVWGQGPEIINPMIAEINAEPQGDYYIGRRYYKVDYKFWGYVRRPGQPWTSAKMVMLNENTKLAPDRELGKIGSDNNYEYKLFGSFSGETVYEPASNGFYPEFILKGYELKTVTPAKIFKVPGATDPERRIVARPY